MRLGVVGTAAVVIARRVVGTVAAVVVTGRVVGAVSGAAVTALGLDLTREATVVGPLEVDLDREALLQPGESAVIRSNSVDPFTRNFTTLPFCFSIRNVCFSAFEPRTVPSTCLTAACAGTVIASAAAIAAAPPRIHCLLFIGFSFSLVSITANRIGGARSGDGRAAQAAVSDSVRSR